MKLKLIFNPGSRRGRAKKCLEKLQKFLDREKIVYDFEKIGGIGQGTFAAKNAVQSGFDTIVSVGGDGLTNEIANGIIGSDASLGVIPCGEGNDFPKMLGVSERNVVEAFKVISEGYTKTMDVGIANGRYFINVMGIGVDGEIGEIKAKAPKFFHGYYAYLYATFPGIFFFKPKKVKIKIDGQTIEETISLVSIGNGKFSGGAFQLTPDAEIDDGVLDVCVVKYTGKLKMLADMAEVIKGQHIYQPYVKMYKAKELEVSSNDILTAHIDGEIAKNNKFQIKIVPKKLKVLVKKPV
jgi:YegS/Rv2252/BmrU family lipid kinase